MFEACGSQATVRVERLLSGEQAIEVDGDKMTAKVLLDGRLELTCGISERVNTLRANLDALRHEYAERQKDIAGLEKDVLQKTCLGLLCTLFSWTSGLSLEAVGRGPRLAR